MGPFKQGLSFFRKHVYLRNGIYYFRLDIPSDLAHHFPTAEIKRSLKTRNPETARLAANRLELKALQGYALLRFGMLSDDMVRQLVDELVPQTRIVLPNASKANLLSSVIVTYTAEKQAGWTDKTKLEVEGVFKLLVDLLGDVEVTTITRPMLVELRSALLRVPPHFYKRNPGKSIKQAVTANEGPGISIKSVNKHMARIGSLLKYCHELAMITNNPATGLQLSEKQRADQERSIYSLEDVRSIMVNLPYDTGTPERYWVPLIGLYSGLRLNEICQLHIDDIVMIDDHWCFDINDTNDKRLKNAASARMVPVHPKLVELGLIRYYETLKAAKQPRLWMNLESIRLHGYTNGIGKWYARYNRDYVTEDPKKVFHSMRHTVADMLKQKGISEVVIAEILGHAHATITSGRYGKRYQPKVLLDALVQLEYETDIAAWQG
ncbi:site-specific integrase [Geomonas nitrogeniifigens]|uniref:site-specific integrase n=1 Tax=Geomonas diazotrophica TaxID=2843197 RepID=UPI001C2C8BB2|nr:site-specific integrase [Geomonas nitrogeniifigens]QXE88112.1 site-specific integrase [Geomonas nitrogeniifigens]